MHVLSLGWEDPLEEGMATHSSILAWRIPWTEELSGLQFTWSQSQTCLQRLIHTCTGVGMCARVHCPQPVDAFLDLKRPCTFKETPSPEAIPMNRDS